MTMTIRETLKKGFDRSGLTYQDFAERAGISLSSAYKKLGGEQIITITEAEAYAKILGVKISAKLKRGGR